MDKKDTEVRERGYTAWNGALVERRFPWSPIARTGIGLAFKKKRFKAFFAVSLAPSLVFLAGIYISERLEDFRKMIKGTGKFLTVDPAFFSNYFTNDALLLFIILLLAMAGSGLVADDIRNNALQLYLSRPLGKKDYILGKLAVPAFFVAVVTLIPGILFVLFKLIFSGSFSFLAQYPWIPLSVVGESLIYVAFFSIYTLALSAASRNSRFVMVVMILVYVFSDVLYGILWAIFRNPATALISLKNDLKQVSAAMFGIKPPFAVHPAWSFAILAVLVLAGFLFVKKRIRGVEVIK